MAEVITIGDRDSLGVVDVIGDEFDFAITINGEPLLFDWADYEGSIGRYLARSGLAGWRSLLADARTLVGEALDSSLPLANQIRPVTRLLCPGRYQVWYGQPPPARGWGIIDFEASEGRANAVIQYYPYDLNLLATQPSSILSSERIGQFESAISGGARPFAICLGGPQDDDYAIIDGHHKFAAYQRLKIEPPVLWINRLNPDAVQKAQGLRFLADARADVRHLANYSKNKTEN